ncbi:MAG: glycosyltransferase family 2 protein [Leptospirales bacterium]
MTRVVSIIIVSYNTVDILRECLTSVMAHCDPETTEVIVVDNASRDGSCMMIRREFPGVRLVALTDNTGFGGGNNAGVEVAITPFIVLLNSDAILSCDIATPLARYLEDHPGVACVGPRIALPDGRSQPKTFGNQPSVWRVAMQSTGLNRVFPKCQLLAGVDGEHRYSADMTVGWLSGVCMAMRREHFMNIGGFDSRFFMYCEDIDLSRRLAIYGRIVSLDTYPVLHYGGASSKTLASRVRNAVWQQRNLLKIISDTSGVFSMLLARLIILPGLLLRLFIGLAIIPKSGTRNNFILLAAWARLRDVLGQSPIATTISS